MATIFKTAVRRKDPQSGKMMQAIDAKGNPLSHPKWRAVVLDHKGRRKTFTLSTNKLQAQKQADMLELREREIRNGIRPVPAAPDVNASRPFAEVAAEYLDWGKAQGGKRGMPWNITHAVMKERHLQFWREALALDVLADVYGILPRVEVECRKMLEAGNTGKTVWHKSESLRSFLLWCKKRKYITENPIEELGKFDTAPKVIRRAMSLDELHRLLENCAPHRKLLYEVAACSGLRENELRQLTPDHLDSENCALRIDREWDKGRKDRTQYIPKALMERLTVFAASNEVKKLYASAIKQQGKRIALKKVPENALLYVPRNCCAMLKTDLKRAGVEVLTARGKLDFHALRTAYINFVLQSKADAKTVQTLARHANFDMTLNVYGRAEEELCREAAEAVGTMVFQGNTRQETSINSHENYIISTEAFEKRDFKNTATIYVIDGCSESQVERAKGIEPS